MKAVGNTTISVGQPAPELELPVVTGETINLKNFQAMPVLISFLSHGG